LQNKRGLFVPLLDSISRTKRSSDKMSTRKQCILLITKVYKANISVKDTQNNLTQNSINGQYNNNRLENTSCFNIYHLTKKCNITAPHLFDTK